MSELQKELWDVLSDLSGEAVLTILTNVHGTKLLDETLHQELVDLWLMDDEGDED